VRPEPKTFSALASLALLCGLWLAFLAVRLTAPPDLMDNDQERPAAYVLDCVRNGHWACQRDSSGEVMSKPPLSTWLAALTTLAAGGRASLIALYLPGALSVLAAAILLYFLGGAVFHGNAGFWAAFAYLVSMTSYKQLALARTDPVFTFTVFLTAFLAFQAWRRRAGWGWFWLGAAAATLTKGPLGILLALAGMAAALWERGLPRVLSDLSDLSDPSDPSDPSDSATALKHPRRGFTNVKFGHALGIPLFLLIVGLWFWAAWRQCGQEFLDKMIGRELIGHALRSPDTKFTWKTPFEPSLYFLSRFAPWSILACLGIWRAFRKPAKEDEERRAERFWTAYLLAGLLILSAASHKRPDLNLPLLPAAALLAGREISRWSRARSRRTLLWGTAGVAVAALAGFGLFSHALRARNPKVRQTVLARDFAKHLIAEGGEDFPFSHVDSPYALQFFLNTMRPEISYEEARGRLAANYQPDFIVVHDMKRFWKETGLTTGTLHVSARCPESGPAYLMVISNSSVRLQKPVIERR
jgi:4-amino-4-deoxy-L-arabinose transferase-like glycosyltransferase